MTFKNISLISSFKNINFVKDNSISAKGVNRTFTIRYESLGEPSCALFWFSVRTSSNKPLALGTNGIYCNAHYPNIPFIGFYNKTNGSLIRFNLLMSITGLANVNFLIKNDHDSLKLTTTVTVSNLNCKRPILDIKNRAIDFLHPKIMKRSSMFSVVGITILDCEFTLKNSKMWSIFEINASNGNSVRSINLISIISAFSAEICIPSNFLNYGTYKFVYEVTMDGEANLFFDSVETFFRIVPTGIAVFPLSGGIKELTIGIGQSIDLDPGQYSYDFDDILSGTQMTFKFFCHILTDNDLQALSNYHYNFDLQQIKDKNISIQSVQINPCFSSSGKKLKI